MVTIDERVPQRLGRLGGQREALHAWDRSARTQGCGGWTEEHSRTSHGGGGQLTRASFSRPSSPMTKQPSASPRARKLLSPRSSNNQTSNTQQLTSSNNMFIDATTPIGLIARLARRHNEPSIIARSKERLADIAGGHDPSNPVIFEGWLQKQAVSAQFNKNWRYRYIIVRCDRIEWHADKPTAEQLPRGYVKLASAIVEPAPQTFGSGWKTFRVADENTSLSLRTKSSVRCARWEGDIKSVMRGSRGRERAAALSVAGR